MPRKPRFFRSRDLSDPRTPSMSPDQVKDALEVGRRKITASMAIEAEAQEAQEAQRQRGVWADNEAAGPPPAQDPPSAPPGAQGAVMVDPVPTGPGYDPGDTSVAAPAPHWGAGSAARAVPTREDWGHQQTIARQLEVGLSGDAPDLPGPAVIPPGVLALLERMEVRTIKAATALHALDENLPAPRTVRHLVRRIAGEFDAMHDSLHALVLGDIEAREVWAERVASEATPMHDALVAERLAILVAEATEARLSFSDTRPDPSDVHAEWIGRPPSPFLGPPAHEVRIDPSTLDREEIVLEETWRDHPDGVMRGHGIRVGVDALAGEAIPPGGDRFDSDPAEVARSEFSCWCQNPEDRRIRGRHHWRTCPNLEPDRNDPVEIMRRVRESGERQAAMEAQSLLGTTGSTRLCLGCVAPGHEHTYGPGCELDRPYDERDQDGEQ